MEPVGLPGGRCPWSVSPCSAWVGGCSSGDDSEASEADTLRQPLRGRATPRLWTPGRPTSSTVIKAIARRPSAGSRWRSSWAVPLERARMTVPAATPASKRSSHRPAAVSKRSRGETRHLPSWVAAISARRLRAPRQGRSRPCGSAVSCVARADRVSAVSLAVDAALDPTRRGRSHRNPPYLGSGPSPRAAPSDIKLTES